MRQRLRWAITARRHVDQMLDAMEAAGTTPTRENIADALAGARFVLANAPDGDHRLGMIAHLLGSLVQIRFYQIRDAGELDEAISLLRRAVERSPLYDCRRAHYEAYHHAHQQRAEAIHRRTGGALPAAASEALETIERALDVAPGTAGSTPHRLLAALATALELRYARSGDFTAGDIEEAIERWRDSLTRMPEHHPDHPIHRSRLARAIRLRADVTGQPDADAYAIEPDQLDLDAAASTWGKVEASSESDLERAIRLSRRAAVAVDHIDPDFAPQVLAVFGSLLLYYYEYCRDGSVLDEAEKVFERSSKLGSVHDQAGYLHGLGRVNQLKFEHSQSIEHLRKSVKYLRQAEARNPADDPKHFTYLFNLGVTLKTWAKETGEPHDEAVQLLERASGGCPDTHPRKPIYLSTLAELRLEQWRASGDTEDFNEAVGAARAAVGFAQGDHRDRVGCSSRLAQALSERYQNSPPGDSRQTADIDEAIELLQWAVSAASGWQRINELANLGVAYVRRYESLRTESDRARAVAALREVARVENASPSKRADAAREWGFLEASVEHWSEAVAAYELAIELLAEAVPPTMARPDQERLLGARFGLAMDAAACCLHLKNPKQAVELLEQGRGVLLGREFDLRSDITQLAERHPRLAERFTRSQQSLATIGAPGAPTDQTDFAEMTDFDGERRTAAFISLADSGSRRSRSHDLSEGESVWREHQLLLAEVRSLDGFDRFLLRPPASELVAAAAQGPIVILNVSQFRSDAIILDLSLNDDGVAVVSLPAVSHSPPAVVEAAAEDGGKDDADDRILREILGWLWTNIAAPVLGRLNLSPQTDPACRSARLWWCPTDWLSFVPVHAASDYEHDKVLGVADYVVSSYTPTIRALLRARENVKKSTVRRRESHVPSIISMPSTPGEADLPGAGHLARIVKSLTPGCVVLEGPDARYETVGNLLETARWVLFACHAEGDEREPSAGRLLLHDHQDRPLTVRDISALNLAGAEFAYLSACATATGPRRALADESIHLAAAFQLAGFPQVIGTLWPVQEYPAKRIAHEFFTALAENPDPSRTAQYLHDAVRKYRRDREHRPDLWAAFIHTGA